MIKKMLKRVKEKEKNHKKELINNKLCYCIFNNENVEICTIDFIVNNELVILIKIRGSAFKPKEKNGIYSKTEELILSLHTGIFNENLEEINNYFTDFEYININNIMNEIL